MCSSHFPHRCCSSSQAHCFCANFDRIQSGSDRKWGAENGVPNGSNVTWYVLPAVSNHEQRCIISLPPRLLLQLDNARAQRKKSCNCNCNCNCVCDCNCSCSCCCTRNEVSVNCAPAWGQVRKSDGQEKKSVRKKENVKPKKENRWAEGSVAERGGGGRERGSLASAELCLFPFESSRLPFGRSWPELRWLALPSPSLKCSERASELNEWSKRKISGNHLKTLTSCYACQAAKI